jgi:general secretion pathway protein E
VTRIEKKKLGDILVERGIITAAELQESLLSQKSSAMRLGDILAKKGLITDEELLQALSEHYGIAFEQNLKFHDPNGLLKKVPIYFLRKNKLVPFSVDKKIIHVGTADPLNIHPFDDFKMIFPDFHFDSVLTSEDEVNRIINEHFEDTATTAGDVIDDMEDSDFDLGGAIAETEDILDMANDAPIIKLVNKVITQAVADRASDIHFEPYEQELVIRYRIDGILYRMISPPKKLQAAIISRIKIMSALNIAENRLPQDGRIQLKIGGKDIDIRVSVFPTHYGERVVLRLLNKTDMKFDLTSIGFDTKNLELFKKLIDKPHGIIVVTGPTGSGKTTTLYSALMRLNTEDVNILTVEDPIEYQLNGVGQMQVKSKIDLTFAAGLRSILRQDPDIIMVGEVRDLETAEIAVQSALTGHRVFTTLHTNDAASAVTRLIDMGIEPFLISSSVNAFLAQRLIRTLCPKCKKPHKPTLAELKDIGVTPVQAKKGKFFKAVGCDACFKTGYSGRVGIYELLPVTNTIRKLVVDRADASRIKEAAISEGMKTLVRDGADKALAGITTIEEILRVSGTVQ